MSVEENPIRTIERDGLTVKYRMPKGAGPHPIALLLHGWTGDENSMWIFEGKMPPGSLMIAPRGLYESQIGGYSWHPKTVNSWPRLSDFNAGIEALRLILRWEQFVEGDFSRLRIAGFSQGAALAYSYVLQRAGRVWAIAGLSGFVPEGAEAAAADKPLDGLSIFVTHGTRDKIVPVERARGGNTILQQAGARVSYCEDDVGHRLSASCFRNMQEFFRYH